MMVVAIVTGLFNLFYIKTINKIYLDRLPLRVVLLLSSWSILFIIEAFVYFLIRRKIERKWPRFHILCILIAFVLHWFVLPFLFYTRNSPAQNYIGEHPGLLQIRFYLFWFFIIAGHVFFIITIVQSFSKNWLPITKDATDTDILDEFLNES